MSHYLPDEQNFKILKDKVVVISGGATGIGAATVQILAQHGAIVVIGDINAEAAQTIKEEHPNVSFVECDVASYGDLYNLFKTAFDKHSRIDHAISCAGIFEQGNWFDPELTIDSVGEDSGNLKTLSVNVIGSLHFARIAAVFLRDGREKGQDRSLVLLSSVNAFRESPGLFIYQVRTSVGWRRWTQFDCVLCRPESTLYKDSYVPQGRRCSNVTVSGSVVTQAVSPQNQRLTRTSN